MANILSLLINADKDLNAIAYSPVLSEFATLRKTSGIPRRVFTGTFGIHEATLVGWEKLKAFPQENQIDAIITVNKSMKRFLADLSKVKKELSIENSPSKEPPAEEVIQVTRPSTVRLRRRDEGGAAPENSVDLEVWNADEARQIQEGIVNG